MKLPIQRKMTDWFVLQSMSKYILEYFAFKEPDNLVDLEHLSIFLQSTAHLIHDFGNELHNIEMPEEYVDLCIFINAYYDYGNFEDEQGFDLGATYGALRVYSEVNKLRSEESR